MEKIYIDATEETPRIVLDAEMGIFEMSGKSLPEDAFDFYRPILEWIEEYEKSPNTETNFVFKMLYFNTTSSKLVLDILMRFEDMVNAGHKVEISWYSLNEDTDMQEAGMEYEEMIEVPFKHYRY